MPLTTSHAPGDPISAADINAIAAAVNALSNYTDEQVRDVIGAALVAGTNVTITVNDAGDTITIAATGGGASVGFAAYKSTVGEANSALPVGSSFAEWRTAARLTLPAVAGDHIVCSGSAFVDNQATTVYFDWAIINPGSGAIIRNYGGGFGQGFASASVYTPVPLGGDFTVAAGDIVSGNVTVAQVWKAGGSGARSLLLADYIYGIRAMNIH